MQLVLLDNFTAGPPPRRGGQGELGRLIANGCDRDVPYTRRFLGGRQPLCGTGVMSVMERTLIPLA